MDRGCWGRVWLSGFFASDDNKSIDQYLLRSIRIVIDPCKNGYAISVFVLCAVERLLLQMRNIQWKVRLFKMAAMRFRIRESWANRWVKAHDSGNFLSCRIGFTERALPRLERPHQRCARENQSLVKVRKGHKFQINLTNRSTTPCELGLLY